MAHNYSNHELVDMLLIYGECGQSAAAAHRLYAERFPNRHSPGAPRFTTLVQRARDTGQLRPQRGCDGGRCKPTRIFKAEENILKLIEGDPTLSIREISRQVCTSNGVVWRTLKEAELYPSYMQKANDLQQSNYSLRVDFCSWLLAKQQCHDFLSTILFSDVAVFTHNGVFNVEDTDQWSIEDPPDFSLNVWTGIVNNFLLGPFILPNRLTGQTYLNFLRNDLPTLLEEVPLDVRQRMWYSHDGAPSHYTCAVRECLNNKFPNRWIGHGGPVSWPPGSLDLNPLHFFFWVYLKNLVYNAKVDDIDALKLRIEAASETIRQRQDIFANVRGSLIRRARLCINEGGGSFEQLL